MRVEDGSSLRQWGAWVKEYRGLSTAAQRRASGRDDSVVG